MKEVMKVMKEVLRGNPRENREILAYGEQKSIPGKF